MRGNVCGKKWNAKRYIRLDSTVALIHKEGERKEIFILYSWRFDYFNKLYPLLKLRRIGNLISSKNKSCGLFFVIFCWLADVNKVAVKIFYYGINSPKFISWLFDKFNSICSKLGSGFMAIVGE